MKSSILYGFAFLIIAGVGCGADQDLLGPLGGGGKAEESGRITDEWAYEHDGWRKYRAREEVAVGGKGSREALIRLYVPPKQGVAITTPPVAKLSVKLRDSDELSDANFSSLLYHDYYFRGPKAGTHKYQIELKPSRAKVEKVSSYRGYTHHSLTWELDEVVGDRSNASTWAISLTSQRWPVGEGGSITSFEMKFKSNLAADDGEWFTVDYWPGMGVTGFKILRDVAVAGRAEPQLSVAPETCILKAGAIYSPFDKVTPLSYRTRITSHRALRPQEIPEIEWYKDANDKWQSRTLRTHVIAVGQIIEEMIGLEEAYCRVRKQGETESFEMECPTGNPDFAKADGILPSYEEYFQATCSDGRKAWIFTTDMWPLYDEYVTDYEPTYDEPVG